jgi:hypothetical protein
MAGPLARPQAAAWPRAGGPWPGRGGSGRRRSVAANSDQESFSFLSDAFARQLLPRPDCGNAMRSQGHGTHSAPCGRHACSPRSVVCHAVVSFLRQTLGMPLAVRAAGSVLLPRTGRDPCPPPEHGGRPHGVRPGRQPDPSGASLYVTHVVRNAASGWSAVQGDASLGPVPSVMACPLDRSSR